MSLEIAVRLCEVLMGLAFLQQSAEHLMAPSGERWLFIVRILLALLLVVGLTPLFIEVLLMLLGLAILYRFQGPYNGGSDRMSLLLLLCLLAFHLAPLRRWQEIAIGYLAAQVVFSYAIAGVVKLANSDWRNGRAMSDVLRFSAYPVSESIRGWVQSRTLLISLSWALILFELCFPFAFVDAVALKMVLIIAASFHLVNACLFGLNRFLWIWLSAYPALVWFQQRVMTSTGP
ncbi:MAG TPA: HTTM domain-containing protein [Candidatus Binatia bacterium]